ncbi:efflux transporter outer membrane subunit [Caulobacter sp. S45]|jgi:multidrug efflux system outer membrane protein|uniref:efflux transporter outer membrane subunit n=1 Tax=Caulobacter sp. S45 TaxID=1641861 RepID=UPI00131DB4BC|nr:efflux transporter outer membrane subunit [Caulobacter sp. S45]
MIARRRLHILLTCAGTLALTACNLAPPYIPPTVDKPPAFKETDGWALAQPQDTAPRGAWWTVFADPDLDRLEEQTTAANQDLQAAVANYDSARAQARIAKAGLFPTLDADGSVSRVRLSRDAANPLPNKDYANYGLGLDLQYEVDVWGRVRNQARAGRARAQAAGGDLAEVGLSLHEEVAVDYFTLRGDDAQQQVLDDTVKAYDKAYELTRARFDAGYAGEPEVAAAEAQYKLAQTQTEDIRLQRAQLEHSLAILTGQPPARFSLAPRTISATPPEVAEVLPAALLQRRPDIAAAERRVEAANADIGVARAAYYPAFNLNAVLGLQAAEPSRVFSAPAQAWSVGPEGLVNLFDGGRRRGLNQQARAAYAATVAAYRQTVLDAYGQVEDSLASVRQLRKEADSQDAGVAAAARSTGQANRLFSGGLSTYYDVVTAQNVELAAKLTAVRIHAQRMVAAVQLIRALGGGWEAASAPPPPAGRSGA